jgi:hypothetical protein
MGCCGGGRWVPLSVSLLANFTNEVLQTKRFARAFTCAKVERSQLGPAPTSSLSRWLQNTTILAWFSSVQGTLFSLLDRFVEPQIHVSYFYNLFKHFIPTEQLNFIFFVLYMYISL